MLIARTDTELKNGEIAIAKARLKTNMIGAGAHRRVSVCSAVLHYKYIGQQKNANGQGD